MTDILLDITNQEMQYIAKEVYQYGKSKSKIYFYLSLKLIILKLQLKLRFENKRRVKKE
jgi:hypothetical protein